MYDAFGLKGHKQTHRKTKVLNDTHKKIVSIVSDHCKCNISFMQKISKREDKQCSR